MSYIEKFKIKNKDDRKKHVFLRTKKILDKKCNATGLPFWRTQFNSCQFSNNTFFDDIKHMVESLGEDFDIKNKNKIQEKLKLLLELCWFYCSIENSSLLKYHLKTEYFSYNGCNCREIRNALHKSIKKLLNKNDEIIFDAKIRIEKTSEKTYPNIYLDPLEWVETIKIIQKSKDLDKDTKDLVSYYYKIDNDLSTKVSIAARLSTKVTEKMDKEKLIENNDKNKIKLLKPLKAVINNSDFRHANDSKYSPKIKLAISDWVVQQCMSYLKLRESILFTNDEE